MRPNSFKTLDSVMTYTDVYDIKNVTFYDVIDDIAIKSTTSFQKFYPYVKEFISKYRVTPEQRERFRFKPDLLGYEVYGSPTLGWFIMWLNGQECPSKFRLKQYIYLVAPDQLENLFITIKSKTGKDLLKNWSSTIN